MAKESKSIGRRFIEAVDASFEHARAFHGASLTAHQHSLNSADNDVRGPKFGDRLLSGLQQVRADRDEIIECGKKLAATLQGQLSVNVLEIVNHFEMEPVSDAPAAILDEWPRVKAELTVAMNVTTNNAQNGTTKGDTKYDKFIRVPGDAEKECARQYVRAHQRHERPTMKGIIGEYVNGNGGSPNSILRCLNDNPHLWKPGRYPYRETT